MRLAVRALGLQHERGEHGIVTFSAGVATLVLGRGAGSWQALVADADAALYTAKAMGRDAVEIFSPPQAASGPVDPPRARGLQAV